MTTLAREKFICPLCRKKFCGNVIRSTNILDCDAEFRPYTGGTQPLRFYVHTCPACGFSAYDFAESLEAREKEEIKGYLTAFGPKPEYQGLAPSRKYEILAHISILRNMPPLDIALEFLRAAWMADDEGDDAASNYRSTALEFLQKALAGNEVGEQERPRVIYLAGELNRRLGRFVTALSWFSRVDPPTPRIAALLKQQQILALQENAARADMPEMP